jgi:hypothetical protein
MIALVILGLGLLFIAAALPVGLKYTEETVNQATGEAAGQFALEQLELCLRTSGDDLYEPSLALLSPSIIERLDNIHRPRDQTPFMPPKYVLQPTYEPVLKVRPLAVGNIGMSRVGSDPQARGAELVDDAEAAIGVYLENFLVSVWGINLSPQTKKREFDFAYSVMPTLSLVNNPVLPGLARVYPPVEPVTRFTVGNFYDDDPAYPTYASRVTTQYESGALTSDQQLRERQKALDRRVAWTAFYRRLSYKGDPGPDGNWFAPPPPAGPDDIADAPLRYELIVVVTRRPTVNHRFPRQDLSAANLATFQTPSALSSTADDDPVGVDRLAPMPWLVTFDSSQGTNWVSPQLTMGTDYAAFVPDSANNPFYMERVLLPDNFADPPTLTFRCTPEVGVLLPLGSILIPAVNDQRYGPAVLGVRPRAGFVPSAPEALPMYEVVEVSEGAAGEPWSIVVENNGYYPWLADPSQPQAWPVWVIPPAFAERDSSGQPVYERTSPIVAVVRRTVTLREVRP